MVKQARAEFNFSAAETFDREKTLMFSSKLLGASVVRCQPYGTNEKVNT